MIEKYKKINLSYSTNYMWENLFKEKLNKNYNLLLIDILIKQKKLVPSELEIINKGLKHISKLCEDYFNEKQELKFIKEILVYLTQIIICNGIEYIMRKILYEYFLLTSTSNNFNDINIYINSIFTTDVNTDLETNTGQKTIEYLLKEDLPERLVRASVKLFEEEEPAKTYNQDESVRDILIELFDNLDIFGDYLPDNIKNIFRTNVVLYFESFTSRTILLWLINIENIFKFFINNYRLTDILLQLKLV
jgi:hypothetical protein